MSTEEIEKLFFRSMDEKLSEAESQSLAEALQKNPTVASELEKFQAIRQSVVRKTPATFGPYFAQKVMAKIEQQRSGIDELIAFFFQRYRLVAIGAFVTLLAINLIFSDQLSLPSVLGVQEESADALADEEIEAFDYSQMFNP